MPEIFSNPVVSILVLIGILIFVHELGHYLVGKFFGFGIETFSIGFGPKIFGFKRGMTTYQISLLPLGGFVKFVGAFPGEVIAKEFEGKELASFAVWKRALMTFAGPFANLLLAFVVFVAVGINGIDHPSSVLGHVRPGSPAYLAGLLPGDKIIQVDDAVVKHWDDLIVTVSQRHSTAVKVHFERDGEKKSLELHPEAKNDEDLNGAKVKVGRIGVSPITLPNFVAVLPDSRAEKSGLKMGDQIVSVEVGSKQELVSEDPALRSGSEMASSSGEFVVKNWNDLVRALAASLSTGSNVGLVVKRDKDQVRLERLFSVDEIKSVVVAAFPSWQDLSSIELGRIIASELGIRDGSLIVEEANLKSGLEKGDYLVSFGERNIADIFELSEIGLENRSPSLNMQIIRAGKLITVPVELSPLEMQKAKGREVAYIIPGKVKGGIGSQDIVRESYSGFASLTYGIERTAQATGTVFMSLVGLFTGQVPLQALGGPMLIAKAAKESAEAGLFVYFTTMAMISINLFLINLLPVPVLDGGHLIMQFIEAVRRKPLSLNAMENYQKIGFAFVLALVILSTYNDIGRFWGSFLGNK
jgi:regulator of sigma E protease